MTTLPALLERFAPITLAEMDGVKLQDRMDTKYVFSEALLPAVLADMLSHYRLLEVDGVRGSHYRSLYFDTPGLRDYHDHHNGRTLRRKVRFREYVGSGLCFLEVKRKTGAGRTDKHRLEVAGIPEALAGDQAVFVAGASRSTEALVPVLWNRFVRLTFVHRERAERLTIDLGLRFSLFHEPSLEAGLDGIVVAELKQGRADRGSHFALAMRAHGIRPAGMSKYCIGLLQLLPTLKYNRFKEVLRHLDRIRQAA
ncbi:MAG TPA: polyphosphate polymerase domain-containing protein [Flavobacteriales bacterium]|nr:polyphosphate polymerase domain-containing protein [Flavobacteriales bacterium]HMR26939.1 polyphosphate polymerase domain-containing protein [Flavobacteriales bacterium]